MPVTTYGNAPRHWIVGTPTEISDWLNQHPGVFVEVAVPIGSLTLLGLPTAQLVCLVRY